MRSDWSVDVREDVESFRGEWLHLTGKDNATPFQSFDVMRQFYRQITDKRLFEPVIALVRHGNGAPAAIFPMLRSRKHGLNWLHTDARPVDYCAPILDPALPTADIPSVIRAVLAKVERADVLYFNRLPAKFLGVANRVVDLPNVARLRLSSWELPLAGLDGAAVLARQQSRFRSNLRSRSKKLGEAHRREFAIAFGGEIRPEDFAEFSALRAESFADKGRSDILSDPDWSGFYQRMITESESAEAWLATLRADGEMIAGLYGFRDRGRVQVILPASKLGEWKSYLPGLQLFNDTILHFLAAGDALYDLSIGDMAYKKRFGCDEIALYDALFPKTFRGFVYYWLWRAKVKIRSKLKPISADS